MSDFSGWSGWLQQHANWPGFFDFFSDTAGPVGWWVLLQLVIVLIGTRRGLRLAWLLCVAIVANTLMKWLWAEPRPYWIDDTINPLRATPGFGMPSGHAQGATALAVGVWLLLRGRILLAFVLAFILFTGLSRIFYGVHSVAQVLVGTAFGVGLSMLVWRVLPELEMRFRRRALGARAGLAAAAVAVVGLLSWLVFSYRQDFVAPAEWLARFEATQLRYGETGSMGLVEGGSLVLIALLAGYALLAVVASERGHRVLICLKSRVQAVLVAIVINIAALAALRELQASVWVAGVWLCVQPLVAIWLPLQWFGVRDDEKSAHG